MKPRRAKIMRLRDDGKTTKQITKKTGATKDQIKRAERRARQDR